jgi:hypothetical protein
MMVSICTSREPHHHQARNVGPVYIHQTDVAQNIASTEDSVYRLQFDMSSGNYGGRICEDPLRDP